MEHVIEILGLILSWQGVAIIAVLLLRRPLSTLISRLVSSNDSKAKIGPIEIELGKLAEKGSQAVHNLNEINVIIAKSRLLELEFAERSINSTFSDAQQRELSSIIRELRVKLREVESKDV